MSKEDIGMEWMKENPGIVYENVALTEDDKKQRIKNLLIITVPKLYELADKTLNDNKKLVNIESSTPENYRKLNQTDFGNKLKEVLKLITKNCVNYIDKRLSNLSILPFELFPKGEYVNYQDFVLHADSDVVANFFKKIAEICSQLNLDKNGFRLITNSGSDAHQTVKHFHVHILAGKPLGPLLSSDNQLR